VGKEGSSFSRSRIAQAGQRRDLSPITHSGQLDVGRMTNIKKAPASVVYIYVFWYKNKSSFWRSRITGGESSFWRSRITESAATNKKP